MENRLGLIMIVKNEALNLDRSLAPVADLFDEVVVVDTGSADRTKEKARDLGAKVVEIDWVDDFALARNRSIEAATADYLFWLDADNAIPPAAVEELRGAIAGVVEPVIGWCTEVLVPRGERLLQKRLFPRREDVRFTGRIHEQLSHPAGFRYVRLAVEISHWGYHRPAAAKRKGERNLALLEKAAAEEPDNFYLLYQLGKTFFQLKRRAEAEEVLGRAVATELGPRENPELYSHALALWAEAAEREGRPETAEERLGQAWRQPLPRPGRGLVAFHLGRLAAARRSWQEAIDYLEEYQNLGLDFLTLDLNPASLDFTAVNLLAKAYGAVGRIEPAVRAYQRAAALRPDNPAPLRDLATLFLAEGKLDQAKLIIDRLQEVKGHKKAARELLKALTKALKAKA